MKSSVLIVDDLAFVRMMIKDILHKYGISVCGEAANGKKKKNIMNLNLILCY